METATYISLDALAAALALPRRFLRQEVERGAIPCLRIGGWLRFEEAEVRKALRKAARMRKGVRHG
jgi:excisionase family DNA binding protein